MKRYKNYSEYLKSDTWKAIRRLKLEEQEHRCQICNDSESLNVHHRIYPYEWGTEKLSDLTVLCYWCHSLFHGNAKLKNRAFEKNNECPECGAAQINGTCHNCQWPLLTIDHVYIDIDSQQIRML